MRQAFVSSVKIDFHIFYNDNEKYDFAFYVKSKEATLMLAYVASLIPEENMASFEVRVSKPVKANQSSLNTRESIKQYIDKTFPKASVLSLEKGVIK